jgi:cell division protein FtsQ
MPRAAVPRYNTMASSAMVMPADIRLMNAVASAVYALAAVGALAAGVLWLMRSPLFPIRSIQLDGDLSRNSVPTIRANAGPMLAGNFYSVDLQKGRAAFETVPWVRRAVVHRVWPDRLAVRLEEHRAEALWEGLAVSAEEVAGDKLVNSYGEIFEANVGDVEQDGLPSFAGPDGSARQVLALYRRLQPVLARLDLAIDKLQLTQRGSWRAELDSGAQIEMGRGSDDEVLARTERFVRTLTQVTARYGQPLEYADLRQAGGYAVRLRGVSTTAPANKTN